MDDHAETSRLETLRRYRLLDTQAEQAFDRIAELAGILCETPINLVSLVDTERQWFKSKVGISVSETPRDYAFCAHAIRQQDLFIVEDARLDQRFADNPLVTDEPGIRFYAGAPLIVENGEALGTLCVIDRKPRQLSDTQKHALGILRDSVVNLMELRKARTDIKAMGSFLPMCAWCRAIKSQDGETEQWQPLDSFVMQTTAVTHTICPSCADNLQQE